MLSLTNKNKPLKTTSNFLQHSTVLPCPGTRGVVYNHVYLHCKVVQSWCRVCNPNNTTFHVFPQALKSFTRSKPCFLIAGLASVPSHVGLTVPYGTGNIICCRKGLCPLCSSSNNVLHAQELCSHKKKVGRERNSMYQITRYASPKYFTNVSAESSHSSGGTALLTLPTW